MQDPVTSQRNFPQKTIADTLQSHCIDKEQKKKIQKNKLPEN